MSMTILIGIQIDSKIAESGMYGTKKEKKVSLLLVTKDWKIFKRNWKFHLWARLQLFRGSSKTVVEPSMNDCFGVDFSKRAFTTSTNCR